MDMDVLARWSDGRVAEKKGFRSREGQEGRRGEEEGIVKREKTKTKEYEERGRARILTNTDEQPREGRDGAGK